MKRTASTLRRLCRERLAKNDRTLAQKIYDKFKDILNIIKSKLKLFDTMNNNPEIRALMNDAESLEQIVNKFHDALDVAKNNYNVHDSGKDAGKNLSFSTETSNGSIIDLTDDSVLTEKVNELHGSEKYNVLRDYIFETLGNKQIKMSDGKFAIVDRSDALHIANKAGNKKSAQIVKIKKLVEKSSLYAEDNNVQHKKFNYFCYYKADVKFKNEVFSIYLNVGKGKNDKKYHIYDITEKIRDTANRINGLERPKPKEGYALKNDVSKNIVSQKLEPVKMNLSMNSSAKSLDEMKADRSTLQDEYRELKGQIDNLKTSAEYIAFEDATKKFGITKKFEYAGYTFVM